MIGYIYCHTSPSNKKYIGQTTSSNPKYRWSGKNSYTSNRYFSAAINKYGWENFSHEILEQHEAESKESLMEKLNEREAFLITKYNTLAPNGYNILPGGHNASPSEETRMLLRKANLGKKLSQETKDKIAEASRNQEWTQERKDNISKALKGRDLGPEFSKKISEALKGNQNAKGHVLSDESKQKARETRKKNGTDRWTDKQHETIRKKREAGELTWKMSDEGRRKISEARKGIIFSEEHRKHISEAQKGKPKPGCKYKHTKEQAQKAWATRRANGKDNIHNKGKIAINNGNKVKYIGSDLEIPEGWKVGGLSPNHVKKFDKTWVNDGQYAYFIPNSELENYLSKGYILGKKGLKTKK